MIVAMSTFLVSVAEMSNIFSILATLMCFFGMVFFIMRNMMYFRIHDDLVFGLPMPHTQQPRIPRMKMLKIKIPFIFKLQESTKTADIVSCTVSSQITYTLRVFWGVSIRELHMFLWKPWHIIQSSLISGDCLQGYYQVKGLQLVKELHSDEVLTMKLPEPPLDLGTPPRLCYPLVVFLTRDDPPISLHPDDSVALISVVHVKDSVCTLPTSVLAQYLKQANGQLSCLKQLYLATGNNTGIEEQVQTLNDDVSSWAVAGEQLCVVCQYYPLSRALLPCRHTCVCSVCFEKLDRCPMCRSPFNSFFTIRNEDYSPVQSSSTESMKPPGLLNWILSRVLPLNP